ncbi:MAG: hypothetical protein CBC24_01370 [Candidatus Pelagibacter sp. TMED64]|nr:DNA replication protein [Candidatus Pelagibacter sp.]OUU67332.1 MAG: hypothetical protein CBC24_01370 [Candidatus Pelagibacter sp. TMED64]
MNEQLIFKFPYKKIFLKEDFYVSKSNFEAFKLIESWPKWLKKSVNISGPKGSGKSHLASILKRKSSSLIINSKDINDGVFLKFKLKEILIIEDLTQKIPENILYSLFNMASQDNKFFLITSEKPISTFNFKLPDLKSRVKSSSILKISLPGDDLIKAILSKSFSDKQIFVDKKYIDFIAKRIERSYDKILKFVNILDRFSLKSGKSLNFKVIKESLKMLNK